MRIAAGAIGAGAALAGSMLYLAATLTSADLVSASFVAALGIRLAAALAARPLRMPAPVIAMAGIMPLVPRLSLYRGFVGLVTEHYLDGSAGLSTAGGVAMALGAGVVLGPMLAPPVRKELASLRRHHRFRRRRAVPILAGVHSKNIVADQQR